METVNWKNMDKDEKIINEKHTASYAVSVIVPIYNVEKYLDECLISLEKQTLSNIEVILVNDGSTDDSGIIAQRYVEQNENFKLVNRENGGLSAARNSGILLASGKYIYFLDSDDYIAITALEELYHKAELEQLDVIKFCAYDFKDGEETNKSWETYKYKGKYPDVYSGTELLNRMRGFNDGCFPSCCMIFVRREIVVSNKLFFYEGIINEDNLFHWKLLAVSERTRVMNKPLYYRRNREGSITAVPQYYNIWRSLVLSAVEAERFLGEHRELVGSGISEDYYEFLYNAIRYGYAFIDKKCRKSKEAKQLYKIERKLLFKRHDLSKTRYLLFAINPHFYNIYMHGIDIIQRIWQKRLFDISR